MAEFPLKVFREFINMFKDHDYVSICLLAIILFSLCGLLLYRPYFIAKKEKIKELESNISSYRMDLIRLWRNGIDSIKDAEWYAHSADTILFRDKAWYSSLRQYMNKEAIEKLEKQPRILIGPSDSGGKFPKKVILLDEVARIEKEWGLTGYAEKVTPK